MLCVPRTTSAMDVAAADLDRSKTKLRAQYFHNQDADVDQLFEHRLLVKDRVHYHGPLLSKHKVDGLRKSMQCFFTWYLPDGTSPRESCALDD